MMKRIAMACVLALVAFGCKKDKEPSPQTETPPAPVASQTTATQVATAAAGSNVENMDIPVEEDFEKEATTDITPDNMEAELDKLEKEIGQ